MTEDWRSTLDDPPDWREGGNVELHDPSGQIIADWLDFDSNDDQPIPDLASGRSFYDFEFWRQKGPSA